MAFGQPLAFWLLPLAALPFFLVLPRPRRTARLVSALPLWTAATQTPAAPAARRWRGDPLAFIQALCLLAMITALAKPAIPAAAAHRVFVIDVSASMGARAGGQSQLDAARREAERVFQSLPGGAGTRVVTAGTSAASLGTFSTSSSLHSALAPVVPEAGRADFADALRLAAQLEPGIAVVVFSDQPGRSSDRVEWVSVAKPLANLAVTALSADPDATPSIVRVVVQISNFGDTPAEAALNIDADERQLVRERVTLGAREARTLTRRLRVQDAPLRARISAAADALDADNTRFAVVQPEHRLKVRLVTSGSFFLERALRANPALEVTTVPPDAAAAPGAADVVVCDGCGALPTIDRPILVVPPPTGAAAPAPIRLALPSHPIAAGIDPATGVAPATPPWPLDGADVILRAGTSPLVTARDDGRTRVAALNADLRSQAFAFSTAFPVIIANTVDWLAAVHENPSEIVAGEPLRWHVRGAAPSVELLGPDGRTVPSKFVNGQLTASAATPGIYTVRGVSGSPRIAVNADTSHESDLSKPSREPVTLQAFETGQSQRPSLDLTTGLLLAALLLIGVEWWLSTRGRSFSALRLAAAGVLVLGIVKLSVPAGRANEHVVFAFDRSDSVPLAAQRAMQQQVERASRNMTSGDSAGAVVFAGDVLVSRRPARGSPLSGASGSVAGGGTDIEAALGAARRSLPKGGDRRVVLISDGNETRGSALREGARAAGDDVRIDVWPIEHDAVMTTVRDVRAPQHVRSGEPFSVAAIVEGRPRTSTRVTLASDDGFAIDRDIDIGDDGTAVVQATERRETSGIVTYRAHVEGEISTAGAAVAVTAPPSILYVSAAGRARTLPLREASVTVATPDRLPASDAELAKYDAVVLDDVHGDAISEARAAALRRHVEYGGAGLLVLGGRDSLPASGYASETLDAVLPIDVRLRPEGRAPAFGFVVLLDKSGSMADRAGGLRKLDMARDAVLRVLSVIPATDSLGLIAFDAQALPLVPLQRRPDVSRLTEALDRLTPSGSTAIAPSLELAAAWLRAAPVQRRRVLIISDGHSSASDIARLQAVTRAGDIELSVIAIGADADRGALDTLARSTGGRAYFPDDLRQLPVIAARDAMQARGGSTVEQSFQVRANPSHPALTGLSGDAPPSLRGYVISTPRAGAEVILSSHLSDPVLAAWRAGLGRVAIYTAGLSTTWSSPFRTWHGFETLWSQTVLWISRRWSSATLEIELSEAGDGIALDANATGPDGAAADVSDVHASVRTPAGDIRDIAMTPAAPGRFHGVVAADAPGTYLASVTVRNPRTREESRILGAHFWSSQRERLSGGVNAPLLRQLAHMTGGRVIRTPEDVFSTQRPLQYESARTPLSLLSLALFVAHLLRRRWTVSFRRGSARHPAPQAA